MVKDTREIFTLILVIVTYFIWILFLWNIHALHPVISVSLLAILLAFHSSLQHELMHGHPFRDQKYNDGLALPALGLFVPYARFKDTHLAHHRDAILTDPYDDPESNYLDPEIWGRLPLWTQRWYRFNNTLLGRMVIGPAIGLSAFYQKDFKEINAGDKVLAGVWAAHSVNVVAVILIVFMLDVPVWIYLMACYLAMSLLKIRTYLEHRAHEHSAGRSVIIESRGPLSWLFLNNNLHAVHHAHPQLAWYDLPKKYQSQRENYLSRNRDYRYKSYLSIFAAYLFRRKDDVPHPLARADREN